MTVWARDVGLPFDDNSMISFEVPVGTNAAIRSMNLGILAPELNPVGWQTMINAQNIAFQASLGNEVHAANLARFASGDPQLLAEVRAEVDAAFDSVGGRGSIPLFNAFG
jgi:hypothetical protein